MEFKKCFPLCMRFIIGEDCHDMCFACLGFRHAEATLEGSDCPQCDLMNVRMLHERLACFGYSIKPCACAGRMSASAAWLLDPREAGVNTEEMGAKQQANLWFSSSLSPDSARPSPVECTHVHLRPSPEARTAVSFSSEDEDAMSVVASDSEDFAIGQAEALSPSGRIFRPLVTYPELLEVITCAVEKLHLDWPDETQSEDRGDCTLPFNNSVDFILQNFGSFSSFALLQDFSNFSRNFSAVGAITVLSLVQLGELVFTPPAKPEDRNDILRRVFDFLLQAPNRDKLINFIPFLETQASKANFSCENYKIIFDRIDQTLSSVSPNQSETLLTIRDSLMMIPPDECIERAGQCTTTPVNETVLCASINSSAVDQLLNGAAPPATGPQNLCNFTVLQYACLPMLSRLSSQQVAELLACKLSSNVTKETWKLFFNKISSRLDDALLSYSNMTPSPSFFLPNVLDAISEVRIDRFSPQRLKDPVFIRTWFQGRLKPFLPSVSQRFLSCLSTKNFSCESYRVIFVELNNNFREIDNTTQRLVFSNFIGPFLSRRQHSGGDCTLPFNNSVDFILQNFGSFSPFALLQDFSNFSHNFSAVEAIPVLSLVQLGELVFSPPAKPEDRNDILRRVFDFFLQAPNRDKLINFIPFLETQASKANFSCENYKIIFDRIDQTLSSVSPNQSETLLTIRDSLMMIPPDECIERAGQCTTTPVNETVLCASINSSAVDQLLNGAAPPATGPQNLCNFTVLQYACLPMLSRLSSQQVAELLACKLSSNVTKETWKLFFTKISSRLDDALLSYSNMTPSPSFFLPNVLDAISEVRIDRFSPQRLKDPVFIRTWFQGRLKPFLPSVSQRFLSCLSTKNFSCESYRVIFVELNNNFREIDNTTQRLVFSNFIGPFLSRRQHSGGDCTLPFNNSVDFILQNFGSFSPFALLQDFSNFSHNFSAVEAIPVLSLVQLGELVFSPPAKPKDRNDILRRVFDFLLQAPNRDKLINFIPFLETQASKANFSCENYKIIFDRIDQTLSSVSPNQSETLLTIRDSLMMIPPDECIERAGQCTTTPVNETVLCASINSSAVDQLLNGAAPSATGPQNLCNFTVLQYACLPMLSRLSSQQVADLLACKLSSNVTKETWKLFFNKISSRLDDALLSYSNMTSSPSNLSLSDVLDVISEVRINRFSPQRLKDPVFIHTWFQGRLKPFLPSVSQRFLSCLSTKNFSCENYRIIVEPLVNAIPRDGKDVCNPTATERQDMIYTELIKAFLSRNDTDDPRCLRDTANSTQWVVRNFGPFVQSAPLKELVTLNRNFTAVDVLPLLSLRQLAEITSTPGIFTNLRNVISVMQIVKDCQLGTFFDIFSPAVQDIPLTQDVKDTLMQQIFDRVSLSNLTIRNEEVLVWINKRLQPLLNNLTESFVAPFFSILNARNCNITQTGLKLLDVVRPSMPINTKNAIYRNILLSIGGAQPLKCYTNNSFIVFLNESLLGFGPIPNLTSFLSLMPPPRKSELINSIAPAELGTYFRQPDVVDNEAEICVVLKSFVKTPEFLDTEDVPDNVKRTVLPCVWPMALASDNQPEIDLWFDHRLRLYVKFLNKTLLGSQDTLNAPCLSYRKMVAVLGNNFTFNDSQLSQRDVFTTIQKYLKTDSVPKCYNSTDPKLNSTAWFANHIGVFMTFVSLDDFYSFGPEDTIKIFTVNPENVQLFKLNPPPKIVINRYTELIFLQNPSFSIFSLPSVLLCDAPPSVFIGLNESQTTTILGNFKTSCSDVDPAISTALAGNIKTINANTFTTLGQESVGLTTVQINSATSTVLNSSLSVLSTVAGWTFGQVTAIVRVLLSGTFELINANNLLSLGSLIGGIPSAKLTEIAPEQILITSKNTIFRQSILSAPEIVQKTYVTQLIKVDQSPAALMTNIPDDMAIQIPRNLLNIPTTVDITVLQKINTKKWKPEQAALFFDTVADKFDQPDDLSVEVLQGFTCSRVQTFTKDKIRGLINACRHRSNRPKVVLSETQLTCMYNQIRGDTPLDFVNYPPDMLLYYNYDTIPRAQCNAYFTQLATADFSKFSTTLRGRRDILWNNAANCFGIKGTGIKKQDLTVLGNLACVLSKDVIENSDPEILENLKNCSELSDAQMMAMETLLLKGTSKYGPPGKWNQITLGSLGILPLYLPQKFWGSFTERDSRKFLKTFLKFLRGQNTAKVHMKRLFKALILTVPRAKREAGCTKGTITSTVISDDAFPFGYSATDFQNCMSAEVVRDNLAGLCAKVDDNELQRVILDKLNEILPNGLSDDQVQVLGSVSKNATVVEINKWSITKTDTLAALMNANDGEWAPTQSNAIITKYLSSNKNLSATELNLIKGPNLCSLNVSTLAAILPDSIRGSDALDVSKCSSDQKKALFSIANRAFPLSSATGQKSILSSFQLIESYLGGADLNYIRNLSLSGVSMSLSTFKNLDPDVVFNLTVSEVQGLLGLNLRDLKTFENETTVQSWITRQLQSELDKLNISLTGGRADSVSPTAATNSTSTNTTMTAATAATTIKSSAVASGIRASEWSVSLTVLIFTIIKMEII
ncbi:uncharacterized protein mslna [Myxocyprinus asiaticus]|uniref:uncharacterized protein mslna n=1 Tax=Myxocyprinus asiaticus TaxID=70543 RepID=UPI002222F8C0|nr:uncharacterized protein mslna [Myxocyprinus asiaticus]